MTTALQTEIERLSLDLHEARETIAKLRKERDALRGALSALIRGYVYTLESGRDRITSLGGQCDPVDVMEARDPYLRAARAALTQGEV